MKRLIVSGCSFTCYKWPAWPYFLANQFDETFNYAQAGAGNEYIFHSIVEADNDLTFTSDDTVIIMWSGYCRFDYFVERSKEDKTFISWNTRGDWLWHMHKDFIKSYLSESGWAKKSTNYMLATAKYLRAKNIPFIFTSIYNLREHLDPLKDESTLANVDKIQDGCNFIFRDGISAWAASNRTEEQKKDNSHPTLKEQRQIAHIMAEQLGLTLNCPDISEYQSWFDETYSQNQIFNYEDKLCETGSYSRLKIGTEFNLVRSYRPDIVEQVLETIKRC